MKAIIKTIMRYILLLAVPVCIIAAWLFRAANRQKRRKSLMETPFPENWQKILEHNLPTYTHLPMDLRNRLHGYVNIFLDEKLFEACGGLEMTDDIRITIAAQACMLLLNHPNRIYPHLKTIFVYPSTYQVGGKGSLGGQIDEHSVRLGESWTRGPVVLAWNSVRQGAINFEDGQNLVIHEFAHQLDQEDGIGDGAPILEQKSAYKTWARVFNREFAHLKDDLRKHKKHIMDKYGATNPAEFFAVTTETFFEKPRQMQKKHPELYEVLKDYYKLDPVQWVSGNNT